MPQKSLNKELLEILACPKCKGSLKLIKDSLKCVKCNTIYEIKEGIPVLMIENED